MKRPEGFDASTGSDPESVPPPSGRARGRLTDRLTSARDAASRLGAETTAKARRLGASTDDQEARVDTPGTSRPSSAPSAPSARTDSSAAGGRVTDLVAPDTTADEAKQRAREARRAARAASVERRRVERVEVRRFTRRSRHRRATLITAGVVTVLLVGSVTIAVFSPLLSLQTITVEGTSRVDKAAVEKAVDGQLGTPLALVDFATITDELKGFPLIASYVTETSPPHTLVIRITERQPIATVAVGTGFELVDPAGIVVQKLDARQDGVPLVDVGGAPLDGAAFRSAAEVLLALPINFRATVDTVTASTTDDVTLSLTSGERVVWGSADDSARKAEVLAGLIRDQSTRDPGASVEYDVSAPDNGIIRTR
ncbi:FtsQ-type POTRA domain-containing protein [Frigoribacterium sp. 2-23]|uniref:FtsQ-type POTRA domain-containing protein n=1 Tax=Frigoribacterium sp. 2-23 TaxID=3415006 RepID=UPI003C6F4285